MKKQFQAAVVTVSDSRTLTQDRSGDTLVRLLTAAGFEVAERLIVTDDEKGIRATLLSLCQKPDISLIITTGGTGFGPRDNTPEATRAVIQREAPGLAEAMRRETASKTPRAMLSRAVCGIRERVLIINLPGSPKAVEECLAVILPILPHAIEIIADQSHHASSE